jgi:drug/metabolite transporter (DMT)-like permease
VSASNARPSALTEQPSVRDWALLFAPGIVWGTSFYFIAEGLESFPSATITPLRIAFGFATLAMFPRARHATIEPGDRRRIVLLGMLWMAFPLSMFPFAEDGRVSSSVTGMLNGATPIFVAVVASTLSKRRPSWARIGGLAVGAAGMALIALPTWGDSASSAVGIIAILAALSSYGIALNLAIPLQQRYGSMPVLWRAQAAAFVPTALFAVPAVDDIEFAWWPFIALVLLGAGGTALAYVLAASNAGKMGSTRTSVTTYIIPPVSILLGALLRDEPIAALAVAGSAVALLGAYIVGRTRD